MSRVINLAKAWTLEDHLGGGGFGTVYRAHNEDGAVAAIKLVPKVAGRSRELLLAQDVSGLPNVVGLEDFGEDGGEYILVMPLADRSLDDELEGRGAPVPVDEAIPILVDLASGLEGVHGRKVVSRDIKPANVLLVAGEWCLSDFGIGRYAAADTGPFTFKNFGSEPYVAPERWRGETATTQADIYSFGVVAHQMLAGELPFQGPEFGDQHQFEAPPRLPGVPPKLASLVFECLDKAPEARPTAANILHRLQNMGTAAGPGAELLRIANAAEVERRAQVSAFMAAAEAYADRRERLAKSAIERLNAIIQTLAEMIAEDAPQAAQGTSAGNAAWGRSLGSATIFCGPTLPVDDNSLTSQSGLFDVIAYSSIGVRISDDAWDYNGRVHSLWFCDAVEKGVYRWYETAFLSISESPTILPFDLPPGPDAALAL